MDEASGCYTVQTQHGAVSATPAMLIDLECAYLRAWVEEAERLQSVADSDIPMEYACCPACGRHHARVDYLKLAVKDSEGSDSDSDGEDSGL